MRVRYLADWNTPLQWIPAGAEVEMTAEDAKPLLDGGIVEAVQEKRERAIAKKGEKAVTE